MVATTPPEAGANPLTRALDEVGDKWCLLIIQEVFWGINTFSGMLEATGVSRGVLADRLKWLQGTRCLRKQPASVGCRGGSYHLTQKSLALHASAMMAIEWERKHYQTPDLDGLKLVHSHCGQIFGPIMRCTNCKSRVHGRDVAYDEETAHEHRLGTKVRRRSSVSSREVPSAHSVYRNLIDLVGDRSTANVIALALEGNRRFEQFHQALPLATNILSDRLKALKRDGILHLSPYNSRPERFEYHLSEKGWDLFPYFLTLRQWGQRWCCSPLQRGPPAPLTHTACGQALVGEVICNQCHKPLTPFSVGVTLS